MTKDPNICGASLQATHRGGTTIFYWLRNLFSAVAAIVAPRGDRESDTKTTDYLMWRHPVDSCELPDLVS